MHAIRAATLNPCLVVWAKEQLSKPESAPYHDISSCGPSDHPPGPYLNLQMLPPIRSPPHLPGLRRCLPGKYYISRLPHEHGRKPWERHVAGGETLDFPPTWSWIEGRRPPTKCVGEVVVDAVDFYAVHQSTLQDVVISAERVYELYSKDRGLLGLVYPKAGGGVGLRSQDWL